MLFHPYCVIFEYGVFRNMQLGWAKEEYWLHLENSWKNYADQSYERCTGVYECVVFVKAMIANGQPGCDVKLCHSNNAHKVIVQ